MNAIICFLMAFMSSFVGSRLEGGRVGFSELFRQPFYTIRQGGEPPPPTSQSTTPLPREGILAAKQIFRTPVETTPTKAERPMPNAQ